MTKRLFALLLLLFLLFSASFSLAQGPLNNTSNHSSNRVAPSTTYEIISRYDAWMNFFGLLPHSIPYVAFDQESSILYYDKMALYFNDNQEVYIATFIVPFDSLSDESYKIELVSFLSSLGETDLLYWLDYYDDDTKELEAWSSVWIQLYPEIVRDIVTSIDPEPHLQKLKSLIYPTADKQIVPILVPQNKKTGDYAIAFQNLHVSSEGISLKETPISSDIEDKNKNNKNIVFDYKTIARNPELYIGETAYLAGYVVQVTGSREEGYFIRLATSGKFDDIVALFIPPDAAPSFNILDNDHLMLHVAMDGTTSYKSVLGAKITLPKVIADTVDLIED